MKKYRTEKEGSMLRIIALKDFSDVMKGDVGGLIEKEENLSQEGRCWVYEGARVSENAQVYGSVKISGDARVFGDARVCGHTEIKGDVKVSGKACISGKTEIKGYKNTEG